ncbi:nucleoside phosphorylase [Haladaptatus sp. CMAA 1911]|uniref:nucleoside phosphorylase n=1 Tax=unclassified Haladaptatus TaxID=2622732 RepID=UPI003754B2EA
MPFPNHPTKHDSAPLVTPRRSSEYKTERSDEELEKPPTAVILVYSRSLMEYLVETHDGRAIDHYYGDCYAFADTDHTVGVVGNFGIGAPTTAMLMEDLVTDGVEAFLSVGFAGSLDESIAMGDLIVCEEAIRDEGTSHHYAESEKYALPSESLTAETKRLLERRDEGFHAGTSWTIDAIYRETEAEVRRYAEEGVLTVEMEASAVFAVAYYRGVDAGSMFVVSDYLGLSEWEPKFHLTAEDMHHLGETAKEILASYVN